MKKHEQLTQKIIFRSLFIFALITIASVQMAWADEQSACGGDIKVREVRYFPISGTLNTNSEDTRSDGMDNFAVRLEGKIHYLRAPGTVLKNRPVLIFNHGHEQNRGEVCGTVRFFTDHNWVVFVPLWRGHTLDKNDDGDTDDADEISSTGIHIDRYVNYCMRTLAEASVSFRPHLYCTSTQFCRPDVPCASANKRNAVETDYLNQQRTDIREQIAYIRSLRAFTDPDVTTNFKLADAKQIAIIGHSYGGTAVLMANAHDYGQNIAVSVSGGELSWGDDEPYWEFDLLTAMESQTRPMYFLQPKNGRTLLPTKRLFSAAVENGFRSMAQIFPSAPCEVEGDVSPCDDDPDPEWRQAHNTFLSDEQVALWGPGVIEFSKRYKRQ